MRSDLEQAHVLSDGVMVVQHAVLDVAEIAVLVRGDPRARHV